MIKYLTIENLFRALIWLSVIVLLYHVVSLIFPIYWSKPFYYAGFFGYIFFSTIQSSFLVAIIIVMAWLRLWYVFPYVLIYYGHLLFHNFFLIGPSYLWLFSAKISLAGKFIVVVTLIQFVIALIGMSTVITRYLSTYKKV